MSVRVSQDSADTLPRKSLSSDNPISVRVSQDSADTLPRGSRHWASWNNPMPVRVSKVS